MKSFIETSTLGVVSPVKFRINKPIRELSSSTIRYQKRKYMSFNENCKQSYPKLVAPGQENKFASIFSSESEENDTVLENLKFLYQAYQIADSEKQRALILSAIPNKTYTIKQIMTMFSCNKNRVLQARKWRNTFGSLSFNGEKTFT